MPEILVKPIRHASPVGQGKRLAKVTKKVFLPWLGVKTVQFSTKTQCHEIENCDEYTKKEKDACWYQKSEYRRMKLTRNLAEKQLGKGKPLPEDEDVPIGLETSKDSQLRAICSVQSVRSVLIEQEIQKWETEGDPQQAISDVYFHSSFACRLDARERALRLESQLTPGRWLSESSEHNNSGHGECSSSSNSDAPSMPTRGRGNSSTSSSEPQRNSPRSPTRGYPIMPIRAESVRGLGEGPVRMPSFSENDGSEGEGPYHGISDFGGEDLDNDSFHHTTSTPPHPSSTAAARTSSSFPRQPQRKMSITIVSSVSSVSSDDDDSWASAQRAASTINSLAAT